MPRPLAALRRDAVVALAALIAVVVVALAIVLLGREPATIEPAAVAEFGRASADLDGRTIDEPLSDDALVREQLDERAFAQGREPQRSADGPFGGITFGQLLGPCDWKDGSPISDFEVACLASSGERRVASPRDAVLVSDLAAGGLLVVTARDRCPRLVDPSELAARFASEGAPVELRLMGSATIVVDIDPPLAGQSPIDRALLFPFLSGDIFSSNRPPKDFESDAARALVLREVALGRGDVVRRAALLARIHGDRELARSITLAGNEPNDAVTPWSTREQRGGLGARLTLEHVPAGPSVVVGFPSDVPLALDSHRTIFARRAAIEGNVATEPLVLARGEVLHLRVYQEPTSAFFGSITTAVPWPPPKLTLSFHETVSGQNYGGSTSISVSPPTSGPGGSFERIGLTSGHYMLSANWNDVRGGGLTIQRSFDLEPGQRLDLGDLSSVGAGDVVVTIRARFIDALGESIPFGSSMLDDCVASGRLTRLFDLGDEPGSTSERGARPRRESRGTQSPTIDVRLQEGAPTVVSGLEPGVYSFKIFGLARRSPPTPADVPESMPLEYREDWLTYTQLPAHGATVLELPPEMTIVVESDTSIDCDIKIGGSAKYTFEVPVDSDLTFADLRVLAWCVNRDDGSVAAVPPFSWQGLPGEPGLASSSLVLLAGNWTLFTILALPPSVQHIPRWYVARDELVVEAATDPCIRPVLATAATLRRAASRSGEAVALPRYAEFPTWSNVMARAVPRGDATDFVALVPDCEFVLDDGRTVSTGGPGSVVELDE